MQSFPGFAGYYRHFVERFFKLTLPLIELTKKATEFEWTNKSEKSFQELKRKLITTPILALPMHGKEFEVFCNASDQGIGCVLMQEGKVITYA